jgi:ribonucleotide reductase alpha subunit
VDQHIDMLAAFQRYTCNAVSKTINAPNDDTRENVGRAIFRAYRAGCKGFTYYRDGSRTEQVVTFSKDGDIKNGNRDAQTGNAGGQANTERPKGTANAGKTTITTGHATPDTEIIRGANEDGLDVEALLAKANALLEVR